MIGKGIVVLAVLSVLFILGWRDAAPLPQTDALPGIESIFLGSIARRNGIEVVRVRLDGKACLILFAYPHGAGITCDWTQP